MATDGKDICPVSPGLANNGAFCIGVLTMARLCATIPQRCGGDSKVLNVSLK